MTTPLPAAKPEDVGLSTPALQRLARALEDRVARGHIPGAVALITRHGKVAFHQAFGARDPASGAPMPLDAIFRIYSMTKPMVSVAAMMLCEEGRLLLSDPIAKYLPEFAEPRVAVFSGDMMGTTDAARPITVQDLLRHTSGLTYEFRGTTPLHKAYMEARVARLRQTNAEQAATLAKLPLLHQPGTQWEYSRSTDVLGRLVEVLSGQTLGSFLAERILAPLGMADSGFWVPPPHQHRVAEAFPRDPESGGVVSLLDVKRTAIFESGGGGMVAHRDGLRTLPAHAAQRRRVRGHAIARPQDDRIDDGGPPGRDRHRRTGARPRLRPWLRRAPGSRDRAVPRLGRQLLLGRCRRHNVLGGPGRASHRGVDAPGPRPARALPRAIPRPGLRRRHGLKDNLSAAAHQ